MIYIIAYIIHFPNILFFRVAQSFSGHIVIPRCVQKKAEIGVLCCILMAAFDFMVRLLCSRTNVSQPILILSGFMDCCHVLHKWKYVCGYLRIHSVLIATSVLMACLIPTATVLTQPILFLFGSMVSWHVTARVKYVWGLQAAHSILMATTAFIVSIISKTSIASRPISILLGFHRLLSCWRY